MSEIVLPVADYVMLANSQICLLQEIFSYVQLETPIPLDQHVTSKSIKETFHETD